MDSLVTGFSQQALVGAVQLLDEQGWGGGGGGGGGAPVVPPVVPPLVACPLVVPVELEVADTTTVPDI